MSNSERFGLKAQHIDAIQQVLSSFSAIDTVLIYGSRAKGNYKPGSDIDLTIKTSGKAEDNLLFNVINALDDLDLAYSIDVSIFDSIKNENLVEHIQRVGVEFYKRGN